MLHGGKLLRAEEKVEARKLIYRDFFSTDASLFLFPWLMLPT